MTVRKMVNIDLRYEGKVFLFPWLEGRLLLIMLLDGI